LINIIQITDPHLTKDKNTEIKTCKTYYSFKRVIHWIDKNENPNFILVSGDISGDGSAESYLLYKNKIESSGIHVQAGLQFKVLMLDSFLFYRHTFATDLVPDADAFGSLNFRIGLGI